MDNVYTFMNKYKNVNLGQIFTPPHMALFASKLLKINENDNVLDACAGTGALLFATIEQGAKTVYGIEIDEAVYKTLENNLKGINHETICDSMLNESAMEWIKEKDITKVIINPPYETKWKTFDILRNVLTSVKPGTMVALFYPNTKLDKSSKRWKQWFLLNNRLHKIIKMPKGLFNPYVSVETSIFIIEAGVPQNGKKIFTCNIADDGLVTKKKQYAQDSKGKWKNELEAYWLDVCMNEAGDETCKFIEPDERLSYKDPEKPFQIYEEDFRKTAFDYLCFKKGIDPKQIREKIADKVCYGGGRIVSSKEYNLLKILCLMKDTYIMLPAKDDGSPDFDYFQEVVDGIQDDKERTEFFKSIVMTKKQNEML